MGRYFALTLDTLNQFQTKTKIKPKPTIKMKVNWGFWISALLIVFLFSYLIQANNLSTKGYQIKALEKKLSELKELNKKSELQASSLESMQNLQDTVKTLNLVPSSKVNYPGQDGYAYENHLTN